MNDLNLQIKTMVVRYLYLDVAPESITDSEDILKTFNLDPAMLAGIALGLEEKFGITVSEKDFNPECFSRVSGIASFVQSKLDKLEQRRIEAIAAIELVFKDVRRGEGVSLHEADVIDGYGTREELKEARAKDNEDSWQGVPHDDIARYSWIFPFFDPAGFRYYIPAYMIWSLNNEGDSVESTVEALKAHGNLKKVSPDSERIKILNTEQSKAIAKFFVYMIQSRRCDVKFAKRTFDRYWSKFLKLENMSDRKP